MQFINFPKIDYKVMGIEKLKIPKMIKTKQIYNDSKIDDLPTTIITQMRNNISDKSKYKGKRLCITAGSRGIPNIDLMIKTIIDELLIWGAEPFIVPAMGSHAGATAESQTQMLAEVFNITEETMGVPILSSMDTVEIGQLADGTHVHCDKNAYESDGIIILNKVKPHTHFRGKHESGLAKMMAIGLGKHKGAAAFHSKGFKTFPNRIPEVCNVFLEHAPIAFGVGMVQNAYDNISDLEIMESEDILEKDAELLVIAKEKMAKLKMDSVDILIIDEIGKNISGAGADPNVTGRSTEPGFSDILDLKRLFVRGLTEETHHNASGLGIADITTRRVVNNIDFASTWTNIITAGAIEGACTPMYAENDRDALLLAMKSCVGENFDNLRIARIKNTLELEMIEISETMHKELSLRDDIEFISEPYDIEFDENGFIIN